MISQRFSSKHGTKYTQNNMKTGAHPPKKGIQGYDKQRGMEKSKRSKILPNRHFIDSKLVFKKKIDG